MIRNKFTSSERKKSWKRKPGVRRLNTSLFLVALWQKREKIFAEVTAQIVARHPQESQKE